MAYCQRNVEVALAPVNDVASGYIDDLLVGTIRKQEHSERDMLLQHDVDIRRTLEALRKARLVDSCPKCKFFIKEVEGCGNVLRDGHSSPMPGKLR